MLRQRTIRNPRTAISVLRQRILEAAMLAVQNGDDSGFCVACGAERMGVEPDARQYPCEECGQRRVYGAEELLMMLL